MASFTTRVTHQLQGSLPMRSAQLSKGRMSVSGTNILDENGQKWCMRGFVYGHGELWHTTDPAEDKMLGANCARILVRAWGGGYNGNTYTAPTLDGESSSDFGNLTPAYLAYIKQQALAIKAAGLKLNVGFDSNCGQNGNQDAATQGYCSLYDGAAWQPGQNFFTTLGKAQKLPLHLNRIRIVMRVLRGLVDFVELLVEPNPGATGGTQADVNAFYLQAMNIALVEDPNLIFILGGFSYQHGNIQDPFTQGPNWPTTNLVGTCDLLDNIMTSGAVNYAAAVADMTTARSKGYPVVCQQAGTQASSDADGSLLATNLELLRTASGGSIGWTFWERVSRNSGSYGPWTDPGTGRTFTGSSRLAAISKAMQAAPIFV